MISAARPPAAAIVSIGFALLLGGCGLFGKKDAESQPMELEPIASSLQVSRIWSRTIGDGPGRSGLGLAPVAVDGLVWVADRRGRIESLDPATGSVARTIDLGLRLSAGPAVFPERIAVGTIDGQVVLIDRAGGEVLWRAQLSSEVLAPPVLQDGILVVRCIDGRVFGLDADSGRRAWVVDRSVPLLTLRGNSAPLVRGGQVFIGQDDGAVTAIELREGERLWEQRISSPEGRSELDRLADIDGPMAIVGLDLYAVTRHGRMASIALDSGRLLWVKDLASHTGLSVSRSLLATADIQDRVHLLDRRSGSTIWTNERLLRRQLTLPVFQGNFVVVADGEGYLHWLDADSGAVVARERASKKPPGAPPLAVDNTVLLLDRDGTLSAWRVGPSS